MDLVDRLKTNPDRIIYVADSWNNKIRKITPVWQ